MKQFKLSSKRKSSGQVVVLLIIVLALLGGAWWWLNSNKENSAKEGTDFAKEAFQKIGVQHDINFFNSRLSPQARMNFPASTQQEFINEIVKLGAPVRPVDVQGKIEFNSQFFEPHGSFHARIYYPARYADMDLTISHPVGRWQIDEIAFIPQTSSPGLDLPPRLHLHLQLRLHRKLHLHLQVRLHRKLHLHLQLHLELEAKRSQRARFPQGSGYSNKRSSESRQICDHVSMVSRRANNSSFARNVRPVIIASRFSTFGSASLNT